MSLLSGDRKSDQSRSNESRQSALSLQAFQRRYTPKPKQRGYPEAIWRQAVRLYADGMNLRRIARQLQLHHQTVANCVTAYADSLPSEPPLPQQSAIIELDELHSFIADKKTQSTL